MPVKLKQRPRRNPETGLQHSIISYLRYAGIRCERLNSGAVSENGRFIRFGFKGCPDIMILGGPFGDRCAFIEVKTPTGKLTQAQSDFAAFCHAHGIPHLVARDLDDVVRWIRSVTPRQ